MNIVSTSRRYLALASLAFALFQGTVFCTQARELPQGVFDYQEKVGDTVIPYQWTVEKHKDGVVVRVIEEGKTFSNYCTEDGATYKWHMTLEGKHDITAVREGNSLEITGLRFGKDHHETVSLDDRPWFQPLSFSLSRFLDSNKEKISFWVIRADKVEAIALTAEKMGDDLLVQGGEKRAARKIEVRAAGFYASFWSATYWYRKSDNLFLRYESVHGLPGTEKTVVKLVSTPAERSPGSQ